MQETQENTKNEGSGARYGYARVSTREQHWERT
jgi:hypothetical protein